MPQYTEQQLKRALRKAVEAGDENAAQFFASEIDAIRAATPEKEKNDSFLDVAKAGLSNLLSGAEAAAIGTFGNLANSGKTTTLSTVAANPIGAIPGLAAAAAEKIIGKANIENRAATVANQLDAARQKTTGNQLTDFVARLPSDLVGGIALAGAPQIMSEGQRQMSDLGVSPEQAVKSGVVGAIINAATLPLGNANTVAGTAAKNAVYNALGQKLSEAADTRLFAGNEKAVQDAKDRLFDVKSAVLAAATGAGLGALGKRGEIKASNKIKAANDLAILNALESGSMSDFVTAYTKANPKATPKEVLRVYNELRPKPVKQEAVPLDEGVTIPADELIGSPDGEFRGGVGGGIPTDTILRVDENGIPIRQDLSEEISMIGKTDLFSDENLQRTALENETKLGANDIVSRQNPTEVNAPDWETTGGVTPRTSQDLTTDDFNIAIPPDSSGIVDMFPQQQTLNLGQSVETIPFRSGVGDPEAMAQIQAARNIAGGLDNQETIPAQLSLGLDTVPEVQTTKSVDLANGQRIVIKYDENSNTIIATDAVTNNPIGMLKPSIIPGTSDKKAHITHIETRADMRGNGVATAMKDMFSDLFDGNVGPSNVQTDLGKKWTKHAWAKNQSGMFHPFADNTFDNLAAAKNAINEYGNKRNAWVKKAAQDLKLPESVLDAVWVKHKEEQKAQKNSSNIPTVSVKQTTAPQNPLNAIAAQKIISDTRPWVEAKADVLAATPEDFTNKKVGILGHKQMGTLHGGLTKWVANHLAKASSEVQAWSRKTGYGQFVQMSGMPILKHAPAAPMPALQALSKQDLNALAGIVTSDTFRNATERFTPQQLLEIGMNKQSAEAWTKITQMQDAYYDKMVELMTAAGRQSEIPNKHPNYVPEKILGNYVIKVTAADGTSLGIYSMDSKLQGNQKKLDIINDLQSRGIDVTTVNISKPRKKSEEFILPSNEAYRYIGTQFRGTGVRGHFKEKKGLSRIAIGEDAGASLIQALETYATKMDQLFTAMTAKQQLEPMLRDTDVAARFPNIRDWAAREAATIGGQRRDGGVFTNINDATNGHLSKIMSATNNAFNLMKVVGNPIRFMYNAAVNGTLVLPARAEFVKAQTGAEGSWVAHSGKALVDMWSMLGKNGVAPETRAALQWLGEQGMLDQSFLKAALHLDAPGYKVIDKINNKIGQGIDVLNRPEHWNRAHMFLTFDNMLKDVVPNKEQRWRTAAEQATEAMVDMSSQGRALMFKENDPLLMSTISPLKSFIMNDYGQMLTYLKSIKDSPTMRGRIMPALNYVVTRLALGGLVSAPLIKEYDAVVGLINSIFEEADFPSFDEMFMDKPWAVTNGVPSGITGLDLSGAAQPFSVADFPVAPQLVWLKRGAEDVARAFKTTDKLDVIQAAKTTGPSIFGQRFDKKRAEENANRVGGEEIILNRKGTEGTVSADTITPLSQITGIRSKERTQAEQKETVLTKKEALYGKMTNMALERAYLAATKGDYDEYVSAVVSLQETFNKLGDTRDALSVTEKYINSRMEKMRTTKETRDLLDGDMAVRRMMLLERQ